MIKHERNMQFYDQPLNFLAYLGIHPEIPIFAVSADLVQISLIDHSIEAQPETVYMSTLEAYDSIIYNFIHVMPQIIFLLENSGNCSIIKWFIAHQNHCILLMQQAILKLDTMVKQQGIRDREISWLYLLANKYAEKYCQNTLVTELPSNPSEYSWHAMPKSGTFYTHLTGHIILSG